MPFTAGFDPTEAKTLIAISAQLENSANLPASDLPPIPGNWTLDYDSPVMGIFDNKYQLWANTAVTGQYAIVIRGTVGQAGSVTEDVLAVMLPASGTFDMLGLDLTYQLAADPQAGVHLGFMLGLYILLYDGVSGIMVQLQARAPKIKELLIGGHSQGAALATLLRSYLHYAKLFQNYGWSYKSYFFAQPKPGNDHYAYDFEHLPDSSAFSFRVTNTLDWVPQIPLTFQLIGDVNTPNPLHTLDPSSPPNALSAAFTADPLIAQTHADIAALFTKASTLQLAKYQPHLGVLADKLLHQTVEKVESIAARTLHLLPSLNFTSAGDSVMLIGTPCNPPDCNHDSWFQHHAATYYQLLVDQYPTG